METSRGNKSLRLDDPQQTVEVTPNQPAQIDTPGISVAGVPRLNPEVNKPPVIEVVVVDEEAEDDERPVFITPRTDPQEARVQVPPLSIGETIAIASARAAIEQNLPTLEGQSLASFGSPFSQTLPPLEGQSFPSVGTSPFKSPQPRLPKSKESLPSIQEESVPVTPIARQAPGVGTPQAPLRPGTGRREPDTPLLLTPKPGPRVISSEEEEEPRRFSTVQHAFLPYERPAAPPIEPKTVQVTVQEEPSVEVVETPQPQPTPGPPTVAASKPRPFPYYSMLDSLQVPRDTKKKRPPTPPPSPPPVVTPERLPTPIEGDEALPELKRKLRKQIELGGEIDDGLIAILRYLLEEQRVEEEEPEDGGVEHYELEESESEQEEEEEDSDRETISTIDIGDYFEEQRIAAEQEAEEEDTELAHYYYSGSDPVPFTKEQKDFYLETRQDPVVYEFIHQQEEREKNGGGLTTDMLTPYNRVSHPTIDKCWVDRRSNTSYYPTGTEGWYYFKLKNRYCDLPEGVVTLSFRGGRKLTGVVKDAVLKMGDLPKEQDPINTQKAALSLVCGICQIQF